MNILIILATLCAIGCNPTEPRDPYFIGEKTTRTKEIHEGVLSEDIIVDVYFQIKLDTIIKGSEIRLAVGNDIILQNYGFIPEGNAIYITKKDKYLNKNYKIVIYRPRFQLWCLVHRKTLKVGGC